MLKSFFRVSKNIQAKIEKIILASLALQVGIPILSKKWNSVNWILRIEFLPFEFQSQRLPVIVENNHTVDLYKTYFNKGVC